MIERQRAECPVCPGFPMHRTCRALAVIVLLALVLTACGGDDSKDSGQIEWITGTPPNQSAQNTEPTPDESTQPTATIDSESIEPTLQSEPTEPTATTTTKVSPTPPPDAVTGRALTDEELEQFAPNELGRVPVLEYHVFINDPKQKAQFVNTPDDLRGDLEWLYDNNFYVVPLRDVILNQINAPAGKHPVVLTFDDSTAGQFRYLFDDDDNPMIDPDSAVGIMEAFYQEHPDFGRGGFFAVLPTDNFCFSWQLEETEDDQRGYCKQKLTFLQDNGYEIGNHTKDHEDLLNVSDDEFVAQLGGAIEAIQALVPDAQADIIAMPFGNYPDLDKHKTQRDMLRNGFTYDGRDIKMLGALMVGSNPAESPVSTDWDPVFIARIQAWDDETKALFPESLGDAASIDDWFSNFEASPELLYTSDGDPNTITIPNDLPPSLDGTFDEDKAANKEIVRY